MQLSAYDVDGLKKHIVQNTTVQNQTYVITKEKQILKVTF